VPDLWGDAREKGLVGLWDECAHRQLERAVIVCGERLQRWRHLRDLALRAVGSRKAGPEQYTMMSEQAQKAMLARMRRIEGQARGVQRMISEDRDCLEILNQLASLRSAAYSASVELTEQYAMQCMREAGNGAPEDDRLIGEAMRGLVEVLLRTPH
jgi:DNA-binding FrmR family transcriptional regulator